MAYGNAEKLLLLVLMLQSSQSGLTLDEIADRLDTSRRTVQRMIAILRSGEMGTEGLQLIEDEIWQQPTRFRIASRTLRQFEQLTPGDLNALEKAIDLLRTQNMAPEATALSRLQAKIRNLADEAELDDAEAEVAYRTEARTFATKPGPRNPLNARLVDAIERAIVDLCQIRFTYRRVGEDDGAPRTMCPFGIIIGRFHYLLAFDADTGVDETGRGLRTYRIDRMSDVEILPDSFVRPERPTVEEFARRAFGIFQEAPRTVRWRFSPAKADEAANFVFHPTQKATREPDGSLTVEFEAGGLKEMAWELFQWEGEVEVLEPEELKQEFAEQIRLARNVV